jgi:drug/metabolite transporter (DMT)-like permease
MYNNWILFSVLAMLANVGKVLTVKYRCGGIDSRVVVFCGRLVSAVVLLPFMWYCGIGFPTDGVFWLVIVVTSLMTAVASVAFTDAVKFGKLTVVMPMQAAVPVFSLLTLWAFWKELPRSASIVLMLLSMAAVAWTLYADSRDKTSNGKMIFVWLSLVSAVLFGVSTILDRVAIGRLAQGALAYSACWNLFSALLMGTEVARAKSLRQMQWRPAVFVLAIYSAAALSAFFFQQYAVQLSQTIAGAVVNVKSIGMLYLPIVVLIETLTSRQRHKPMTLVAGLTAIVLSILLVRSLV